MSRFIIVFFNDTATTEIYPLSLHDALPILLRRLGPRLVLALRAAGAPGVAVAPPWLRAPLARCTRSAERAAESIEPRSEEHTSELQSRQYLVCRLLLEKKRKQNDTQIDLQR